MTPVNTIKIKSLQVIQENQMVSPNSIESEDKPRNYAHHNYLLIPINTMYYLGQCPFRIECITSSSGFEYEIRKSWVQQVNKNIILAWRWSYFLPPQINYFISMNKQNTEIVNVSFNSRSFVPFLIFWPYSSTLKKWPTQWPN